MVGGVGGWKPKKGIAQVQIFRFFDLSDPHLTFTRPGPGPELDNNIADLQEFLPDEVNSGAERNCEVEWEKNNVVATQLEGTWVIKEELSRVLSPSYSPPFSQIKYLTIKSIT